MAANTERIDAALAEKLLLGQLPAEEIESLCARLADGDSLDQFARAVADNDTLLELLKQQRGRTTDRPGDRLEQLMARLALMASQQSESRVAGDVDTPQSACDSAATRPPDSVPPTRDTDLLAPPDHPDELGRLGSYRVLRVLGQGGMGCVYLAEDIRLGRQVALKTIRPDTASAISRERFLREARLAAALEHDHIVPIYQVDEDRGVPFLAMPFLRGESLDARLKRDGQLPLADAVRIARETAEGLAAAHAAGLVHRDVKPANLWLEQKRDEGGRMKDEKLSDSSLILPPSSFRVKILDFGLARPVESADGLTQSGAIVGTPGYMAPEQVEGGKVDGRADLFSLGCVLYRMLAGRTPFEGKTVARILASMMTETPPSLRSLNLKVPAGLSDLVARLLAREPEDRPASADEVAEALRRFGAESSPPRHKEHKGGTKKKRILALCTLGVLCAFVVYAAVVIIRDRTGKEVARIEVPEGGSVKLENGDKSDEDTTKVALPKVEPKQSTQAPRPRTAYDDLKREDIPPYELAMAGGGDPAKAPKELVAVIGDSRMRHWNDIGSLAFSSDGSKLVSVGRDRHAHFWDSQSGQQLTPSVEHPLYPASLAVAQQAGRCALSVWKETGEPGTFIISMSTQRQEKWLPGFGGYRMGISADGRILAATSGGPIPIVCDVQTGQQIILVPKEKGHLQGVSGVAVSSDGKWIATAGRHDGTVKIWDVTGRKEHQSFDGDGTSDESQLLFAPDGKLLIQGNNTGLRIWNLATGKLEFKAGAQVLSLAVSADGSLLAAGLYGMGVKVWKLGKEPKECFGRNDGRSIQAVAFRGKDNVLATGDTAGIIRLFDPITGKEMTPSRTEYLSSPTAFALSADGSSLATISPDYSIRVWDVASGKAKPSIAEAKTAYGTPDYFLNRIALSPDGPQIAFGSGFHVILADAQTGKEIRTVAKHGNAIQSVAFSPDGNHLASWCSSNQCKISDVATGKELYGSPQNFGFLPRSPFSPDGKLLLAYGGNEAQILEVPTGKKLHTIREHEGQYLRGAVFSPDGALILTQAEGPENILGLPTTLWDAKTGEERRRLRGVASYGGSFVPFFSPDSKLVVAYHFDEGAIHFLDPNASPGSPTLRRKIVLAPVGGQVYKAAYTPDGRHLVTLNGNGTIYVLRVEEGAK